MKTSEMTETGKFENWQVNELDSCIEFTKTKFNNYRIKKTKKQDGHVFTVYGFNEPTQKSLINWSELSRRLNRQRSSIRENYMPNDLKEPINELTTFFDNWIEKHKAV